MTRLEALTKAASQDPFVYQELKATEHRLLRYFARGEAVGRTNRLYETFETMCLMCGATMTAHRSSKRTCSPKCRQALLRFRRRYRQQQKGGA
jgi:hypothetical protein